MVSQFGGPPTRAEKDEFRYLTENAEVSAEEAADLLGRVYD
jgi:hypothetical protein